MSQMSETGSDATCVALPTSDQLNKCEQLTRDQRGRRGSRGPPLRATGGAPSPWGAPGPSGSGGTAAPVHDPLPLQVLQAAAQLCHVEDRSLLIDAGAAQVGDVELQVPSVHDGEHQAQGVFGFVRVAQAHLETAASQTQDTCSPWPSPPADSTQGGLGVRAPTLLQGCARLGASGPFLAEDPEPVLN